MNRPIWSFDDMHIGELNSEGSTLSSRLIPRPKGLENGEWYIFAGNVCKEYARALIDLESKCK